VRVRVRVRVRVQVQQLAVQLEQGLAAELAAGLA
jgi:hypothetical protein